MLKSTKLTVAAVMVCFAIMAISSNCVLADDDCGPAPVAKTGQTTCYDQSNNVIDCPDTGHDGDIQAGVAWPEPRFTDNGNGTVTDNLTGLIWLKDASCSDLAGSVSNGRGSWTTALSASNTLAEGTCDLTDGSSAGDWRLPNIRELHSLIDFGNYTPALPSGHPFIDVQSDYYWSNTTFGASSLYAWYVNINTGYVDGFNKPSSLSVWPVRGISRPSAGSPQPNADFDLWSLRIRKFKRFDWTMISMWGTIDLPDLNLHDGDTVESRVTIELFDVLPDDGDLVISEDPTLKVKDRRRILIIRK